MPRQQRNDEPGAWHHVMNRGLARRTLFESDRDTRKFLSLLARSVRAGRLEVHAYCVLTTHFHLLVRSPAGELSAVMQWVMNQYVRWFNRSRRRDGPLMRGRFMSKRAESSTYRRHLVRYIDFNAVDAGLVPIPALYPHGSARHYARRAGPPWLARSWIEYEIAEFFPGRPHGPSAYAALFGDPLPPALQHWIERRAQHPHNPPDPLDELLACAPAKVFAWMRVKAELADGTQVGQPLCDAESVEAVLLEVQSSIGEWSIELERGRTSAWLMLRIGLRRLLCAATLREIAAATSLSTHAVWNFSRRHAASLLSDARYAATAAELTSAALRRCHLSSEASRQRGDA